MQQDQRLACRALPGLWPGIWCSCAGAGSACPLPRLGRRGPWLHTQARRQLGTAGICPDCQAAGTDPPYTTPAGGGEALTAGVWLYLRAKGARGG